MSFAVRRRILDIVATDATFERTEHRGQEVWLGKCLHCNAYLVIGLDGEPISRATIEHIVPQVHGGTDDLGNLGRRARAAIREKAPATTVTSAGTPGCVKSWIGCWRAAGNVGGTRARSDLRTVSTSLPTSRRDHHRPRFLIAPRRRSRAIPRASPIPDAERERLTV
ncbi:hypothetical protein ACN28S_47185 [Cystobacter fuscus]